MRYAAFDGDNRKSDWFENIEIAHDFCDQCNFIEPNVKSTKELMMKEFEIWNTL